MKKSFWTLLSIIILWGGLAQAQALIPDKNKKGKWGFVNESGKTVIKYDFNEVTAFVDGRAKVKKGDKWGYIDVNGKEVIKIKYSEMLTWDGNYCKIAEGGSIKDGVLKGAKWGYINRNGDVVLKAEYDEIGSFKDGIAHIVKGGKYGYIDDNYQIFIPCKFTAVGSFNKYGFCWVNEGGAFDRSNTKKIVGGKYGIYNRRGELIVPVKYKMIGTFTHTPAEANPFVAKIIDSEEYAERAKKILKDSWKQRDVNTGGLFSTSVNINVDKGLTYSRDSLKALFEELSGKLPKEDQILMKECGSYELLAYKFLTPEKFSILEMPINKFFAVSNSYNEYMQLDYRTVRTNRNDKIGIVNEYGEVILEAGKYPIVYFPTEGLIPVAREKKEKLQINYYSIKTGKLMMKSWLDASGITPFRNGVAVVINDDSQYLIDRVGRKISAEYSFILPPKDDVYITKRGSYGLINDSGQEIIPSSYNLILPMSEHLMCVQEKYNGSYGYINKSGQYVIPSQYIAANSFNFGSAIVETVSGCGVINPKGEIVIKPVWKDVLAFSEVSPEFAWVKDAERLWKCIVVATGESAFENKFFGVNNFNSNGVAFVSDSKGMIGAVSRKGEIIIPMFLDSVDKADKCYEYLIKNGKTVMSDVEVYRFNLNYESKRNEYRLTEKISENLWDF